MSIIDSNWRLADLVMRGGGMEGGVCGKGCSKMKIGEREGEYNLSD